MIKAGGGGDTIWTGPNVMALLVFAHKNQRLQKQGILRLLTSTGFFVRVNREFLLVLVRSSTKHSSLKRRVQKLGTCTVSGEW